MWRQLLVLLALTTGSHVIAGERRREKIVECPAVCEPEKCPNIGPIKLSECPKPYIKIDRCNCCRRCDIVHITTTLSPLKRDEVCEKVTCPKKRLCMLNIQGLPVCKCPTIDLCRDATARKKNKVCGSDGITYPSRCHVKVASCQADKKIRAVHRGDCVTTQPALQSLDGADMEIAVTIDKTSPQSSHRVAQEVLDLGEEVTDLLAVQRGVGQSARRERRKERKRERKRQQGGRRRRKKNKQNKQRRMESLLL